MAEMTEKELEDRKRFDGKWGREIREAESTPDKKQEALLPLTTYKNKRVASDDERFRLNSELNTYLFNNCDHEHDGYPNHLACRPCVLDCLADIASRASVAAPQGDAALVEQVVEAVWRNVKRYEDGEIWMDTLRAKAQVKKLLPTVMLLAHSFDSCSPVGCRGSAGADLVFTALIVIAMFRPNSIVRSLVSARSASSIHLAHHSKVALSGFSMAQPPAFHGVRLARY